MGSPLLGAISDNAPVIGLGGMGAVIVAILSLLLKQYATAQSTWKVLADERKAQADELAEDLRACHVELDTARRLGLEAETRAAHAQVISTANEARVDTLGLQIEELRLRLLQEPLHPRHHGGGHDDIHPEGT